MVTINGEAQAKDGMMLLEYLKAAGYDSRAVAVEYNGAILAKDAYETTELRAGDVVEVVCFMGGGACAAPGLMTGRIWRLEQQERRR